MKMGLDLLPVRMERNLRGLREVAALRAVMVASLSAATGTLHQNPRYARTRAAPPVMMGAALSALRMGLLLPTPGPPVPKDPDSGNPSAVTVQSLSVPMEPSLLILRSPRV